MKNLSKLKNQAFPFAVEVLGFDGPELLVERLHEIGFHKGCQLKIVGVAPFDGPLVVEFETAVVALRDEESACLQVKTHPQI